MESQFHELSPEQLEKQREFLAGHVRPKTGSEVVVTYRSVDTGEVKALGSLQAHHIKTTITVEPSKGAETEPARVETDAWYLDVSGLGCMSEPQQPYLWQRLQFGDNDRIVTKYEGPKPIGLVVEGSATTRQAGNEIVNKTELLEVSDQPLDDGLFELPPDYVPPHRATIWQTQELWYPARSNSLSSANADMRLESSGMSRTQLYADPANRFVHDLILDSCQHFGNRIAIVDSSCERRISYAEYGEIVEALARGLISAGVKPGEVVAIFLQNSWEFCAVYHAITLAGAVPTLLNPTYREREVLYQFEDSGAVLLISDGPQLEGINLAGLPNLRGIYTIREHLPKTSPFSDLLRPASGALPNPAGSSNQILAALPYSSGTTGLPKGVMLSHLNLVANVFQLIGPDAYPLTPDDVLLCFLPLYHIYGLNVGLNPILAQGGTIVLMPRFNVERFLELVVGESVTYTLVAPPALLALVHAAEAGLWPKSHHLRRLKSGAAPLAPELAHRFMALTGVPITQGYGMTEASPVTHIGYYDAVRCKPESIGHPVAQTECRVINVNGEPAADGEPGELIMRGPQIMLGYWKSPDATAAAIRDGWYYSGDIVTRDTNGYYYVLDRSKEMIKYKGFSIAPAEIEAVLLEHPAVRDCGVVGKKDSATGEFPVAFVVAEDGFADKRGFDQELCSFVASRLAHYKQPREIRFVSAVPKTASGKILRRELRKALE